MSIGFREVRDGRPYLVFERRFTAPIGDVWACLTESERLGRWFGTWTGDPATGRVRVAWTAEEGAPESDYQIEVCEPPRRLRLHNVDDDPTRVWTLDLDLTESAGVTLLRFAQAVDPHVDVADVGPGWQYYLKRLEVAAAGGDADSVTWGEGWTSLGEQYARAFGAAATEPH